MGLKDSFSAWLNQDVNNLAKTGFRSSGGTATVGDMRSKPPPEVATNPSLEVVPITVVFEIVQMIKDSYSEHSAGSGALQAVWAINNRLYSPNQTRVRHTLVMLDVLYKNCGIIFANTVAIYLHLFRNFLERKEVSQANVELAIGFVAGWQSVEHDRTYDLINKSGLDPIDKMSRFFDNLVKAKYPFTEAQLAGIPAERLEALRSAKNIMTGSDFMNGGASKLNDGRDIQFKTYKAGSHAV
ncbi:hypothetical protein HDU98_009681 [Podochytrium sp. JEL0797]|nr:hypothetical protein HDU98_009681 [Podochytrium sp. JEL0797]